MRGSRARPCPVQTQTLLEPAERLLHGVARESGRMLGAEEVLRLGCSTTRVAALGVAGQCLCRGRMERYESGLAELGLADDEDAVDEVDVAGREPAGPRRAAGRSRPVRRSTPHRWRASVRVGATSGLPGAGARRLPPGCRCGAAGVAGGVPGARPVAPRSPGRRARGAARTVVRRQAGVRPAPDWSIARTAPTRRRAQSSGDRCDRSGLRSRQSSATAIRAFRG